ncbi:MAG TPA: GMC family oxidoreductase N-terminal domain-containing protein [Steroidobacteraceae bacterium]|nr:GMC family oxidoreductase N-terminal domain-containing protein [Steroidobacteraceae bacterium]HRX88073.1 GMC family oxidoreductase N-terminal domain-containing protein [Steroidobacteraceae bacterium]
MDAPTSDVDYVIVGAGSAGCVLARRLSEAGTKVLVLEAGGQDALPEIHNPQAWPFLQGTAVDWQYKTLADRNFKPSLHRSLLRRTGFRVRPSPPSSDPAQ